MGLLMIVDCDQYRQNYRETHLLLCDLSQEERRDKVSVLAAATHVPIIVVICYCLEMFGRDKQLEDRLKNLVRFYHIEEIVNCKVPLWD